MPLFTDTITNIFRLQCPLEIATLDIAAALSIATSTPVTEASRYIQCALYKISILILIPYSALSFDPDIDTDYHQMH